MKPSGPELQQLQAMIAEARRCVVFTGAGISTESGIPDFRSPGGIWSKVRPIEFHDFLKSAEKRRHYWRQKFTFDRDLQQARPNSGHFAVARLVQAGKAACVITQNIDGLHQASGVPPAQVVELHGNTTYAACLDCGRRYDLAPIRKAFLESETLPVCRDCNGLVKTATISFGQPMPVDAMQRAEAETLACDLFLAIGSSLVVYPAAGFPQLAKRNGARLVIINRDPTPLDEIADLVLHSEIGPTLASATSRSRS